MEKEEAADFGDSLAVTTSLSSEILRPIPASGAVAAKPTSSAGGRSGGKAKKARSAAAAIVCPLCQQTPEDPSSD